MIDLLVPPPSTWSAPKLKPAATPLSRSRPAPPVTWQQLAAKEEWEAAILGYLQQYWRATHPLWRMINEIVAQSHQPSRSAIRAAAKEVLAIVMKLRRERRIFRYRRKLVATLDVG